MLGRPSGVAGRAIPEHDIVASGQFVEHETRCDVRASIVGATSTVSTRTLCNGPRHIPRERRYVGGGLEEPSKTDLDTGRIPHVEHFEGRRVTPGSFLPTGKTRSRGCLPRCCHYKLVERALRASARGLGGRLPFWTSHMLLRPAGANVSTRREQQHACTRDRHVL